MKFLDKVIRSVEAYSKRVVRRPRFVETGFLICEVCNGGGVVAYTPGVKSDSSRPCDVCGGTGKVQIRVEVTRV